MEDRDPLKIFTHPDLELGMSFDNFFTGFYDILNKLWNRMVFRASYFPHVRKTTGSSGGQKRGRRG
jgi:hypothetical protein